MSVVRLAGWGHHMACDIYKAHAAQIRNAAVIKDFAKALVKKIDMKPYGPPQVVHFGDDGKMGYTLVQLIETSNICAHFVEETNDIYLDVFSCKPFAAADVEAVVKEYFMPEHIATQYLFRQAAPSPAAVLAHALRGGAIDYP